VAATTECRGAENECDVAESCSGNSASCPAANPTPVCQTFLGCSPGFYKTHTEGWDGGADDFTSTIKTYTTWASLGVTTCDGKNLLSPASDTLGDTIARPNGPSTNTLFHLSACLASADAFSSEPGAFPYTLAALKTAIQSACAAGGAQLTALKNECAAANTHDEITIFCPLD
jgi:hypothetical protein